MRRAWLIATLIFLTGCKKDPNDPVSSSILPGPCSAMSPTDYTGAVVPGSCPAGSPAPCGTRYQTVLVQADVIDHPRDILVVRLCKAADCSWTTPSVNIVFGRSVVYFVNAEEPGFTDYQIHEQLCR